MRLEIDLLTRGNACQQINLILLTTFTIFNLFVEYYKWKNDPFTILLKNIKKKTIKWNYSFLPTISVMN